MDFDKLLQQEVGVFGRYQCFITFLVGSYGLFCLFNQLETIFTSGFPDYVCKDNYTELNKSSISQCYTSSANGSEVDCRTWQYDMDKYGETIVTQFNLVCSNQFLVATTQSIFMAGNMVGLLISGLCADRFGRLRTFFLCHFMNIIARLVSSLSPIFTVHAISRFFVAAFSIGSYTCLYVLGTELVGTKWRLFVNVLGASFWSIGFMVLPGFAYLTKDRFTLEMIFTALSIIPLSYFWLLPESPRWLFSVGRDKEADQIVRVIAKRNGNEITDPRPLKLSKNIVNDGCESEGDDNEHLETICDVMKSPILVYRTLVNMFLWMSNIFIYYGLALNTGNLMGDVYLNTFISGLVDLIAAIAVQFIMNSRFGRQKPIIALLILAGTLLLLTTTVSKYGTFAVVGLSMAGKFAIAMSFGGVYTYTPELYHTSFRGTGLSMASTAGRVGSIIAPFVGALGVTNPLLPPLLFGIFALAAAAIMITLPETRNRPLPQSIAEAEKMRSNLTSCTRRSLNVKTPMSAART